MEAYSDFASVYDELMDATPYEEWKKTIVGILKEDGIDDGLVLDLGCGTGTMTQLLAQSGYDMIGVDLSVSMLNIAMEKREQSRLDILYLCQDMRKFELYGTVRAIISICDSVNYILETEELVKTFSLVNNYLDPSGLFIFDFNTVHKYRDVIGDSVIAENREDCSFIWENYFDRESMINEYELTIFVRDHESDETNQKYVKFEEFHYQRGYELATMLSCLEKAGLQVMKTMDSDTLENPNEMSERITVIAREQGKKFIRNRSR